MTVLSNADKLTIVDQKVKNIEYQRYSFDLDLQLENSVASPEEENVSMINNKIADLDAKLGILNAEKARLEE
jgi:hypothetical protein